MKKSKDFTQLVGVTFSNTTGVRPDQAACRHPRDSHTEIKLTYLRPAGKPLQLTEVQRESEKDAKMVTRRMAAETTQVIEIIFSR